MPSIEDKIDKWFIDTSKTGQAVPRPRHEWARVGEDASASNVRPHAHATVTPIYEGNNYMKKWHDGLTAVANSSDPSKCRVYHSAWRIEQAETLGVGNGGTSSTLVENAESAGADVYMMGSGHAWMIFETDDFIDDVGVATCAVDTRYASFGSIHQKFTVFRRSEPEDDSALVGSLDIDGHRWDRRPHDHTDPERSGDPTHEIGVEVTGDALSDIEWEFVQRYRDESRDNWIGDLEGPGFVGTPPDLPKSDEPPTRNDQQGDHRVQVLLTYGRGNDYSWSDASEFTVWASYINAIEQASTYLYIECQYFSHLGDYKEPWYDEDGLQHASLFYQLGEAIERGVTVIVVVPRHAELGLYQLKRDQGIRFLRNVAATASGDFHVAFLSNGTSNIYVHSKIMLCDDEFTLVGSSNFNQRSMATDGELQLGVLDENDQFTENVRRNVWNEHLDGSNTLTGTIQSQISTFSDAIAQNDGRLRTYTTDEPPWAWECGVDPYNGPEERSIRRDG